MKNYPELLFVSFDRKSRSYFSWGSEIYKKKIKIKIKGSDQEIELKMCLY